MSTFHFGVGSGRMTNREEARRCKIAKKHNASFVCINGGNHGQCVCGYGCRMDRCPIKSYWFSSANMGEPFDSATERAVMAEVRAGAK